MNIILPLVYTILFIFLIKKLLTLVEEFDTIMSIRKELKSAELFYRQKYEFKSRVDKVVRCGKDSTLDFTQFKGRL